MVRACRVVDQPVLSLMRAGHAVRMKSPSDKGCQGQAACSAPRDEDAMGSVAWIKHGLDLEASATFDTREARFWLKDAQRRVADGAQASP